MNKIILLLMSGCVSVPSDRRVLIEELVTGCLAEYAKTDAEKDACYSLGDAYCDQDGFGPSCYVGAEYMSRLGR